MSRCPRASPMALMLTPWCMSLVAKECRSTCVANGGRFKPLHRRRCSSTWLTAAGCKGMKGGPHAEEQLALRALGASLAQVIDEHVGRLIGQKQLERLPGLGLDHAQAAAAPINVIEGQTHQLAAAQPICRRQIEKSEVTPAKRFGTVDRLDERLNLHSGKSAR